jgi:plastocyanin
MQIISTSFVFALAACGSSSTGTYAAPGMQSPTTPVTGGGTTVAATPSLSFSPSTLTVNAGDTVTFAFGSVGHNVNFDTGAAPPADIAGVNANVSIQRVFTTAGTYSYHCNIHPGMAGTVVVK